MTGRLALPVFGLAPSLCCVAPLKATGRLLHLVADLTGRDQVWPNPSLAKSGYQVCHFDQHTSSLAEDQQFGQDQVWPDQVWPRPSLARPSAGQSNIVRVSEQQQGVAGRTGDRWPSTQNTAYVTPFVSTCGARRPKADNNAQPHEVLKSKGGGFGVLGFQGFKGLGFRHLGFTLGRSLGLRSVCRCLGL